MTDFSLLTYGLVGVGTLAGSLLLTPAAMRLARVVGLVDRPSSHKFHKTPTPYLGGIAVAIAVIVGTLVPGSIRLETVVVAAAAGVLAAIGALDDWKTLRPSAKLAVQGMAAAALWVVNVRVTPTHFDPLDFALTVFLVLAIVNSLNLLDNMDGLASGVAAIAAGFFFIIAFDKGQAFVALLCAALMGGCLGFLPYNFSRARVFLGDAGTLFIGFLLAAVAIEVDLSGYPLITRGAVPWLILAAPFFDTAFVIMSRLRGGRPVFRGGTDHTSHRVVALGATPRQAALATYMLGILSGGLALVVVAAKSVEVTTAVVVAALVMALSLAFILERVELPAAGVAEEAGVAASRAT